MDEDSSTINYTNGFIKHVFNFDNETKCELLNITAICCFSNNSHGILQLRLLIQSFLKRTKVKVI